MYPEIFKIISREKGIVAVVRLGFRSDFDGGGR